MAQEGTRPKVALIAALQRDRGIGKDNQLLWRIPDDLARFKALTLGHPVVMGRKTWESLPTSVRPLPGRTNIVVTRNTEYEAPGATVVSSLEEALASVAGTHTVFVIGGAELYAAALPIADRLYLTLIEATKESDVFFPPYEDTFTQVLAREDREYEGIPYSWIDLERG